jgi:hypothetical protein
MDINIQDKHYKKYIKYKTKYLELKKQSGGSFYTKSVVDNTSIKLGEFRDQKTNDYNKISNMENYFDNDLVKDLKKFNKDYDHEKLTELNEKIKNQLIYKKVISYRFTKEENLKKLNDNITKVLNFIDYHLKTMPNVKILKDLIDEYLLTYKAYINNDYK